MICQNLSTLSLQKLISLRFTKLNFHDFLLLSIQICLLKYINKIELKGIINLNNAWLPVLNINTI